MCSQKHQPPRRAKLTTQRYSCHFHIVPSDLQLSLHACMLDRSFSGSLMHSHCCGVMAVLLLTRVTITQAFLLLLGSQILPSLLALNHAPFLP